MWPRWTHGAHAEEGHSSQESCDSADDAENHQESLLGAGSAEGFALILLSNCWCDYASFAEGKPRLQEVKLLATDPLSQPSFTWVPHRLQDVT